MDSAQFLIRVWGDQEGFVFLPQKRKRWNEGPAYKWPMTEKKLWEVLNARVREDADQYYCPNVFSSPARRNEGVNPSQWLYADLDAVDPRAIDIRPSLAIQSSPGRFQALWQTSKTLTADNHDDLNRRLTYAVGADRGGWDLSQVLRLPGTVNHKYPFTPTVRILWDDGPSYPLSRIRKYVAAISSHDVDAGISSLVLPEESASDLRKQYWQRFDSRTKALLADKGEHKSKDEGGEGIRSDRLWELECRLLEAGLSPQEVFVVVRSTNWNKFEGRQGGDDQLWSEVQKASVHIGTFVEETGPNGGGLIRVRPRIVTYADLMGSRIQEPDWAIEDWWTLGSHGVIAGLPKSYKSLVTLDMAVSVASETPFLGQYGVNHRAVGPVLITQQENSLALLRDRLIKVSASRGLQTGSATANGDSLVIELPPALPIFFYNDFGFDMTNPDDRESIEETILQEGIKTAIFDPLYLMIGGADENSAQDMRPILSWLLRVRNLYNCAVVVVHHWGKGTPNRGGRGVGGIRLLGSTTIYGWLEAALYLENHGVEESTGATKIVVEREFRERLSPPPLGMKLAMGDIGNPDYEWTSGGVQGTRHEVLTLVENNGANGVTMRQVRAVLGWGEKKTRAELNRLVDFGTLIDKKEGKERRFFIADSESSPGD